MYFYIVLYIKLALWVQPWCCLRETPSILYFSIITSVKHTFVFLWHKATTVINAWPHFLSVLDRITLRSCEQSVCVERQRGCAARSSSTRILPSGKLSWSPSASTWRADQVRDNAAQTHTHTHTHTIHTLFTQGGVHTAAHTSNSHLRAGNCWLCRSSMMIHCLVFETGFVWNGTYFTFLWYF